MLANLLIKVFLLEAKGFWYELLFDRFLLLLLLFIFNTDNEDIDLEIDFSFLYDTMLFSILLCLVNFNLPISGGDPNRFF
jgi:hypothetical protein